MTLTLEMIALFAPPVLVTLMVLLACRHIVRLRRREVFSPDWQVDYSCDRYRPMFRLLEEEDLRFLRNQPGATPGMVKRLRQHRCSVFRGYLRCLQHDFQMASDALVLVMLHSETDRRDVLRALVRHRFKFATGVLRVRLRLLLYRWNVAQESVERLVSLFEGLQLELLALAPSPDSASV